MDEFKGSFMPVILQNGRLFYPQEYLNLILDLCVRRRPSADCPEAIRWTVTLPGDWGDGFPTKEAACEAVLTRAAEGGNDGWRT